MLSVEEAYHIVLEHHTDFPIETVSLTEALGRVLREPLYADRDLPPFDRVTMDGIAIAFKAWESGQRTFEIAGVSPAGIPQFVLPTDRHCVEVMTGTMLPLGTDTVIRYEDLQITNGHATITVEEINAGQNIHYQGQDRRAGDIIVAAGRRITPAELGVAASVGKPFLQVTKRPRAVVISTGDELIPVHETPLLHQIRSSNGLALQAALSAWGVQADNLHLRDDAAIIERELARCLAEYDFILFSGGVSAGKFDYVPAALEKLEVKKLFHKVNQRPGKPFWFGQSVDGKAVFALPGNPVSTFMCLHRYVRAWLEVSLGGGAPAPTFAILAEDYTFKPDLTYFLQVKLTPQADGSCLATPITGNGSGDLSNLVDADSFLELPHSQTFFNKGQVFQLWTYR